MTNGVRLATMQLVDIYLPYVLFVYATSKPGVRIMRFVIAAGMFLSLLCAMSVWSFLTPPEALADATTMGPANQTHVETTDTHGPGTSDSHPVLFLGNHALPPMNYLKDGAPSGIVVDLAKALAQRMPYPVAIQLMDWGGGPRGTRP